MTKRDNGDENQEALETRMAFLMRDVEESSHVRLVVVAAVVSVRAKERGGTKFACPEKRWIGETNERKSVQQRPRDETLSGMAMLGVKQGWQPPHPGTPIKEKHEAWG